MIKNGDIIKITYTARTEDGKVVDTTDEEVAKENEIYNEKMKYGKRTVIVGSDHLIRGLDEDLVGKEVGYTGSVTVPPSKGFGERNPELVETYTITKFPERPYPGMHVVLDNKVGIVETVIGRRARVDFNHPLAGKTLIYEYTIREKIEGVREKVIELSKLYIGEVPDVVVEEDTAVLTLPENFPSELGKSLRRLVSQEIFRNVDLARVRWVEEWKNPRKEKEEEKEEKKELSPDV
jgi:FKBP-type peptidyl-prolyl cis-trans isomerase SlyD